MAAHRLLPFHVPPTRCLIPRALAMTVLVAFLCLRLQKPSAHCHCSVAARARESCSETLSPSSPSLRPHPDLLRHLSPSSTECVPPYSVSLSTRFRRMMQTTRMALQRRAFASSQAAFASVRHHPHLPSPSRGTCVDSVCPRVLACVASAAIYERRFGRSSSIAWSDPTMLPPPSAPPLR